METVGQNTMTSEMVDDLYRKEDVGKDIFEKKIELLQEELKNLTPKAEDRLWTSIYGTDKEKEEQNKTSENFDRSRELIDKIDDYKEYAAKRRLTDTGHGLNNTRIYPSKKLRNKILL